MFSVFTYAALCVTSCTKKLHRPQKILPRIFLPIYSKTLVLFLIRNYYRYIDMATSAGQLKEHNMNTQGVNTFIDSINEAAGYEYISDRAEVLDEIVETRDSIESFIASQNHTESRTTVAGTIEVFELAGSCELQVMDFGDYRLCLKD